MKPRLLVALVIATILAGWYACGGSGGSSNSTPTAPSSGATSSSATMFEGTIAGSGGQSGAFAVTIQTAIAPSSASLLFRSIETLYGLMVRSVEAATAPVSGSLALTGGDTVALTGTFDSTANGVSLSGGGFTFTGTISGAVLSGTYTGPSGTGGFSSLNATQTSVTAYCGTYQKSSESGVFNIDISADGAMSGATSDGCLLTGQLSGDTFTLICSGGSGGKGTGSGATGTVQSGTVTGTIASGGTITGSNSTCTVPTPPSQNLGMYTINVNVVAGSPATAGIRKPGGPSVCATFQDRGNKLSPCATVIIGQTGQITVMASPGVSYTLAIPPGQPISSSCSIVSGGSGVFGPSMSTAVVSCS